MLMIRAGMLSDPSDAELLAVVVVLERQRSANDKDTDLGSLSLDA